MPDSWDQLDQEIRGDKAAAAPVATAAPAEDDWKIFQTKGDGPPGFFQRFSENVPHPIDLMHQAWSSAVEHAGKAQEAFKAGNYSQAAAHAGLALPVMSSIAGIVGPGLEHSKAELDAADAAAKQGDTVGRIQHDVGAIPLVGPSIANAIQDVRDQNYAGLAGGLTGAATTALLPKVVAKLPTAAASAANAATKINDAVGVPGAAEIASGVPLTAGGAVTLAHGNIYGIPMIASGAGLTVRGLAKRSAAAAEAAGARATAEAGTPLRTVGVLARERAAVPPMPELPGLPPDGGTPPSTPDIYSWARQRMAEEKAAQTGSLQMPAGVDPKVWAAMPPQMQQALVQKVNGQAAPSPATVAAGLPPRDPSHYGVEATQAAKSPAPEVRAAPTAPPLTGPQTTPGAHPVYSLPQTPLDSDFASGVAFHPESQTGLLTLKNGRTAHVPMSADLYRRILAESADPNGSVGRLWNQEIRPGLQTKANTYVQREPAATLPETAAPSFEQRLAASPDAMKVRSEVVRRAASQHLSPAQLEALTHQVVAEINTGRAAGGNAAGLIPDWVAQDVARGFK